MDFASKASLNLVSPALGERLASSLRAVRGIPCVATAELSADAQFQSAVRAAIDSIEARSAGLLERFIEFGASGTRRISPELDSARVSGADADRAVALLHAHAVNAFKGQLAEVLAWGPCCEVLRLAVSEQLVSPASTLYLGDVVKPVRGRGTAKGADCHVLSGAEAAPTLEALAEVKSFSSRAHRIRPQLFAHVRRALNGIRVQPPSGLSYVCAPGCADAGPVLISVTAASWRLGRGYSLESEGDDPRLLLRSDLLPPIPADTVERVGKRHWHVTLGWSHEALNAEGYKLTYWYMERIGERLFAHRSPWPEMTAAEAGANAATQALYDSLLMCRSRVARQRAIALYNVYGFGYALGSSYKDGAGKRHVLWPEDLREMLARRRPAEEPQFRK